MRDRVVDGAKDLVNARYVHLQRKHAATQGLDLAGEAAVSAAVT